MTISAGNIYRLIRGCSRGLLFLIGAFSILLGVAYFPGVRPDKLPGGPQFLSLGVPWVLTIWAVVWVGMGALSVAVGVVKPIRPQYAYAVVGMCILWSFGYVGAWVTGEDPRGWLAAALFLVPAGILWLSVRVSAVSLGWFKGATETEGS